VTKVARKAAAKKVKKYRRKKPTFGLMNWWPGCGRPKPVSKTVVKPGKVRVTVSAPEPVPLKDILERQLILQELAPQKKKKAKRKAKAKKIVYRRFKPQKPQSLRGTSWRCFWHVATLAGLTLEQARSLITVEPYPKDEKGGWQGNWFNRKPETFTVTINYPMRATVRLEIPPTVVCYRRGRSHKETHPGSLLWTVAQHYKKIYAEAEASEKGQKKYGIWGHQLEDLVFEGLSFDKKGNLHLLMGS